MSILSGFKKYKDYILTSSGYQLSSRWTKSDAVIMGDGTDDTNTLEKNCGAIQGITDSLTANNSNIAASSAAVATLNESLKAINGIKFQIVDGKLQYRYDTEVWNDGNVE